MTAAVLADIHGNYVALNACLNEAFSRHITTFIFLGDYIGELPYPERTMEILYELQRNYQCYFIRGNMISHGTVLSRAMEICREETGDCVWPNIPEEFWKKAVEEFIK